MRKLALATSNAYSELTTDERLVLDKLLYFGVDVEPIVWDAKDVTWKQFDAVFIRSCWDYHVRHDEFFRWIDTIVGEGVAVFNSPEILRKNYHKGYLKELVAEGIAVAPTVWLNKESPTNLQTILQEQDWQRAVVKPTISANAESTWLTSTNDPAGDQQQLESMLDKHPEIMVQKYIEQITTRGEWSFIFFECEFSHAVIKHPKEGDFRIQEHLGGGCNSKRPPNNLLAQAQKVIESMDEKCVYARVDGIEVENQLLLMELELIEPALYLDKHPKAPSRFAEAIVSTVNGMAEVKTPGEH